MTTYARTAVQNADIRIVPLLWCLRCAISSTINTFHTPLNHIRQTHDFDGDVEGLCERFYAEDGRPRLWRFWC